MMRLTLSDLLNCIERYLSGASEFSDVRNFVFQYYEAEEDIELDSALDEIFPILLPYLHYEEGFGDPDRRKRLQRLLTVLGNHYKWIKERVVFALAFEEIRSLTEKHIKGVISSNVYHEQMAKLSPVEYACALLEEWGRRHVGYEDPVPELLT